MCVGVAVQPPRGCRIGSAHQPLGVTAVAAAELAMATTATTAAPYMLASLDGMECGYRRTWTCSRLLETRVYVSKVSHPWKGTRTRVGSELHSQFEEEPVENPVGTVKSLNELRAKPWDTIG
ncbi:hypothetical protein Tco_0875452 [Tanacetum coccineum]|uniref:Uncharacterized protein n=1 Tax=Tanacetum coccineum TaxID=301880 RepID=A0ABQ5BPG9_9ASTR